MNIWTGIWFGLLVALVIVLWKRGDLMRLGDYVRETREELKKCTWPTWNELKGSTVVVIISIALVGGFTMVADGIFLTILNGLTKLLT